jgi:hypothetical protein
VAGTVFYQFIKRLMANDKSNKSEENQQDQPITKPDPETLHKTDPQDNMKGPISSLVNGTRKKIEEKGDEIPAEKDDKE